MAIATVPEHPNSFNACHCPCAQTRENWQDLIEGNVAKSRALLQVGMLQGLHLCSETTQFHYLAVVDDLLELIQESVMQMQASL